CSRASSGHSADQHPGEWIQEEKTDQGAPHGAPQPAGCRTESREVDSLLDMNFSTLWALHNAGVFQAYQILLLQRTQFVQHFVGCMNSVEVKYHQVAHVVLLNNLTRLPQTD